MVKLLTTGKEFAVFSLLFVLMAVVSAITQLYILVIVPFTILLFYAGWINPSFVFYLLLITLPFSFEYSVSPEMGTDVPDELLMVLSSGIIFFYISFNQELLFKHILKHPLAGILLIYLLWLLVSSLFSSNFIVSLKFLLAKTWYIGAFVLAPIIVFKEKQNIKTAAILFVTAVVIVTILILVRHKAYNFGFAFINDAVYPFFRNHVNYSAMLVCCVPVVVAFIYYSKGIKWLPCLLLLIGILLVAIFFSFARGAWLALFAGVIAFWLIRRKKIVQAYIITITVSVGFVFWMKNDNRYLLYAHDFKTTIFHKDFGKHLVATYKLKEISTAERFYRWIAGVRMVKDNLLTGVGPGAFYNNYKEYAVPAYKTWVSDNKERSTVHNYFLLTLTEQGIPGLIIFLVLTGTMLWYSQHLYSRSNDKFYKVASMAVGVILVMVLTVNFLSDLIEADKIGSLFFLCMGLLIAIDNNLGEKSYPSTNIEGIP